MKTSFLRFFLNILLVLSLALNGYFLYKKNKPKEQRVVSGGSAGLMGIKDNTNFD